MADKSILVLSYSGSTSYPLNCPQCYIGTLFPLKKKKKGEKSNSISIYQLCCLRLTGFHVVAKFREKEAER